MCAMRQECRDCYSDDLHIISNADGEQPKRLKFDDLRQALLDGAFL